MTPGRGQVGESCCKREAGPSEDGTYWYLAQLSGQNRVCNGMLSPLAMLGVRRKGRSSQTLKCEGCAGHSTVKTGDMKTGSLDARGRSNKKALCHGGVESGVAKGHGAVGMTGNGDKRKRVIGFTWRLVRWSVVLLISLKCGCFDMDFSVLRGRRLGGCGWTRWKDPVRDLSCQIENKPSGIAEEVRKCFASLGTILADSKLPTTFWASAKSTFLLPLRMSREFGSLLSSLITGHHDELFREKMFDGKDDGMVSLLGYSLNYTREIKMQGTFVVEKEWEMTQCKIGVVVMPQFGKEKDASYFDSPSKQMGNDDPKSYCWMMRERSVNEDGF
ncbi:hypothetical protein Tco_1229571 [Tanacetum coccineum]